MVVLSAIFLSMIEFIIGKCPHVFFFINRTGGTSIRFHKELNFLLMLRLLYQEHNKCISVSEKGALLKFMEL